MFEEDDMALRKTATRRDTLKSGAIGAMALVLAPRMAFADAAAVTAEIKKLYGDKKPGEGKVKLDVPQIAENGLVVPVNVEVESPMSSADFVRAVHVWADGNPSPGILSYSFTPQSGKASASARMRLAQTQNIICIAEMSDGKLYSATTQVKVTIGGCGG
jgi:sulfur-oxidizing protein SoxY